MPISTQSEPGLIVSASVRSSFHCYSLPEDVDAVLNFLGADEAGIDRLAGLAGIGTARGGFCSFSHFRPIGGIGGRLAHDASFRGEGFLKMGASSLSSSSGVEKGARRSRKSRASIIGAFLKKRAKGTSIHSRSA